MSDTQQHIILQQRQMQQRQILAMMGIGQWVQPESLTINLADIPVVETASNRIVSNDTAYDSDMGIDSYNTHSSAKDEQPDDTKPTSSQPVSIGSASEERYSGYDSITTQPFSDADSTDEQNHNHTHDINSLATLSPAHLAPETSPVRDVSQTIEPLLESISSQIPTEISVTIAPFDLQAGRYGDWVLLVDIQALTNDSQKLWQNITQALSISCETSSFPICAGMDTAELANASLAGYIFKIGRSENIEVAVLTALPEGLTHPSFTAVPTLADMLADATLKRQLWQQLSSV